MRMCFLAIAIAIAWSPTASAVEARNASPGQVPPGFADMPPLSGLVINTMIGPAAKRDVMPGAFFDAPLQLSTEKESGEFIHSLWKNPRTRMLSSWRPPGDFAPAPLPPQPSEGQPPPPRSKYDMAPEAPIEQQLLNVAERRRIAEMAVEADPALALRFYRNYVDYLLFVMAGKTPIAVQAHPAFAAIREMGAEVMPLLLDHMLEPDGYPDFGLFQALDGRALEFPSWCQDIASRKRFVAKRWLDELDGKANRPPPDKYFRLQSF